MYKKFGIIILLMNLLLLVGIFQLKGLEINEILATQAFQIFVSENSEYMQSTSYIGLIKDAASGQRIVDTNILTKNDSIKITDKDYENLLKIVEAEAGGEDYTGKLLVANVILNRVQNEKFPNTITQVIYQNNNGVSQFSPVSDGRIDTVIVSDETVQAVEDAINGTNISEGALYFAARQYANSDRMRWFDSNLTKLFVHGGHEFFS
ncbi:MAG: cell wall hydrolase [Lachnospiraceae bacterium]